MLQSLDEFKALATCVFPKLVDTKVMASNQPFKVSNTLKYALKILVIFETWQINYQFKVKSNIFICKDKMKDVSALKGKETHPAY